MVVNDSVCDDTHLRTVENKYTLKDNLGRRDPEAWRQYKQSVACFWTPEEADLSKDVQDFAKLKDEEKYFLKVVLAFFNSSDNLVNSNISMNFHNDFSKQTEVLFFLDFQKAIENIHSESYSLMIDTLVKDKIEKKRLFNAVETFPSIRKKANWVCKHMRSDLPLCRRLFAFVLVEGLQFSGSFCSIFFFKKRGLLPGISFFNELISRDEGLHAKFTAMLFRRENERTQNPITQKQAETIVIQCVQAEREFVCDSLNVRLIGMNANLMTQYIQFVADYMLTLCNFKKMYQVENPFPWMESISLQAKTNFFEKRVSEYAKANVGTTEKERTFSLTCDF